MPNLKPPVTTVAAAAAYRQRIREALPAGSPFEPLMTLYLTDETSAQEIARAKASGFVHAVKYYPAGSTTNSQAGVTALANTRSRSKTSTSASVTSPWIASTTPSRSIAASATRVFASAVTPACEFVVAPAG